MAYDFEFGSLTAKGGFASERTIANKFNNWLEDKEAQNWLKILGYDLESIKQVKAIQIPTRISKTFAKKLGLENEEDKEFKKADIQVQVTMVNGTIKSENISVKKANKGANYNQVDRRKVYTYQKVWGFDNEIAEILKLFTGEFTPINYANLFEKYCKIELSQIEDCRRIYLNYLKPKYLQKIIEFFKDKKSQILTDIIKGRGALCAKWLMAVKYDPSSDTTTWALININQALDIFSKGEVKLTKPTKSSLQLSSGIVLQRKGGKPDPTSLQFKIRPLMTFDS